MNHTSTADMQELQEALGGDESRKKIVIDTSVLLSDPDCISSFKDCDLILPLKVIEELDNQKSRGDDVGRAARSVSRALEGYRESAPGNDLRNKVEVGNGSTLRIVINGLALEEITKLGLDTAKSDNRILAAALGLKKGSSGPVELVSGDVNLRIKAAALGLSAKEYIQTSGRTHNEKHPGWYSSWLSRKTIDRLYSEGFLPLEDEELKDLPKMNVNEFGVIKSETGSSVLVRVVTRGGVKGLSVKETRQRAEAWGLKARSKEQSFALDLLLDPEVPVVGLSGRAGTGKTILAVAAAFEQTFEKGSALYDRVMILRPVVPVGNQDLGFLPGTLEEKLGPWMEAITDAMVALGKYDDYAKARDAMSFWVEKGKLTLESVTYLRGRSLQNTFIIVDEAQNLEPLTLKTILTRLGEGSKVVLVGDTSQIDNPWTSEKTNAISVLAERFVGQEIFGHLVLTKGERSKVADVAAELL